MRFRGHFTFFYTVGIHAIYMSRLLQYMSLETFSFSCKPQFVAQLISINTLKLLIYRCVYCMYVYVFPLSHYLHTGFHSIFSEESCSFEKRPKYALEGGPSQCDLTGLHLYRQRPHISPEQTPFISSNGKVMFMLHLDSCRFRIITCS